jgi:hypothetical protein
MSPESAACTPTQVAADPASPGRHAARVAQSESGNRMLREPESPGLLNILLGCLKNSQGTKLFSRGNTWGDVKGESVCPWHPILIILGAINESNSVQLHTERSYSWISYSTDNSLEEIVRAYLVFHRPELE